MICEMSARISLKTRAPGNGCENLFSSQKLVTLRNPRKQDGQIYSGVWLANQLSRSHSNELFYPCHFQKTLLKRKARSLCWLTCVMKDDCSPVSAELCVKYSQILVCSCSLWFREFRLCNYEFGWIYPGSLLAKTFWQSTESIWLELFCNVQQSRCIIFFSP